MHLFCLSFCRFGQVKSAKCSNNCVFVNYCTPDGPSKAMARLQGQDFLGNKAVRVRYPDNAKGKRPKNYSFERQLI